MAQKSRSAPIITVGTHFARPDVKRFAPIYCAEHYFSGPWPCGCPPGPQVLASNSTAGEVSLGGGRGGGKTEWLFAMMGKGNQSLIKFKPGDKLRNVDVTYIVHPNYRGLILIEQASDVGYILDRAQDFYGITGAQINRSSPAEIIFPSGAKILLGHFGEDGWKKCLGPQYQRIAFDQLEKMRLRETYDRILGSLRSKWPELKEQSFNTWNPGGGEDLEGAPGQAWIMEHFNVEAYLDGRVKPWQTVRDASGSTKHFIFSKVMDNPFFRWKTETDADGTYWRVHRFKCRACGHVSEGAHPPPSCLGCGKEDEVAA